MPTAFFRVSIAVQMGFADVEIISVYTALQYRKETLYSIGVNVVANVFLSGMVHGLMAGELLADSQVNVALVSPKVRGLVDPGFQDWANPIGGNGWLVGRGDFFPAPPPKKKGPLSGLVYV